MEENKKASDKREMHGKSEMRKGIINQQLNYRLVRK